MSGNNPEHENIRYFYALSDIIKSTELLTELVIKDFKNTFWSERDLISQYISACISSE